MTDEYRFECVECGAVIRAAGADPETARRRARERGADHVNDAHADRLAEAADRPDELAPDDLLTGAAAYGSMHGWLAPEDHLLVCADCGYYFGDPEIDERREPVGDGGLICAACYDRRVHDRVEAVTRAVDDFLR
ncbi:MULTISPECIES: hypothetical protein [Halorussus]|uniref:hypothetical protein n=1 Tax=Halorussus TaxID=1070314 RepID=UPI0020A11474|nr:hypothetical protein [Halorussus vallis]USZ75374.1 hypothetical protein NGM07_18315 [Halorussus vallis]